MALEPRQGQGPRRFGNPPGIVEDVLDGGADLVGADQDDLVHPLPGDAEGLLPDQPHRHTIGEETDLRQFHPLARRQGAVEGGGVLRLHANDLDLRSHVFDVGSNPGDEPPAAHGDVDSMQGLGVLAQDFHGDGALAGDHIRVVEGVNEGQPPLRHPLHGLGIGLIVGIAMQHGLGAKAPHRLDLDGWRGPRHDNSGLDPQSRRPHGHPLGMIAGGGGDNPTRQRLRAEMNELVVGAAQFEGEDRLQVLAFEQYLVA